jgi:hypothetical protein
VESIIVSIPIVVPFSRFASFSHYDYEMVRLLRELARACVCVRACARACVREMVLFLSARVCL